MQGKSISLVVLTQELMLNCKDIEPAITPSLEQVCQWCVNLCKVSNPNVEG